MGVGDMGCCGQLTMEEVFSKAVVALSSIETEGESGWCSIVKIFIYMIKKWKYDDKE